MYLPNTFFPHAQPLSVKPSIPQTLTEKSGWIHTSKKSKVLFEHEVYEKISKNQYPALRRAGKIPTAIPSMCVLVVKNYKYGKPLRAKSRILVLGNFEDSLYQNPQRYAPVLKYISLCLLKSKAVGDKRILQQGD